MIPYLCPFGCPNQNIVPYEPAGKYAYRCQDCASAFMVIIDPDEKRNELIQRLEKLPRNHPAVRATGCGR